MATTLPQTASMNPRRVTAGLVALACALAVLALAPASVTAQDDSSPPPEVVILARSDNPADALGAGPVAGVLGAPVLVNPSAFLLDGVADAIASIDPDLVIIAGGEAAISAQVEAEVSALGYATRRAAGADRHETAVLLANILTEFGVGRPVLSGRAVTDAVIPGLNAELLDGFTADELMAGEGAEGPEGPAGPEGPEGPEGPAGADARPASDVTIYVDADGTPSENGAALVEALADLPSVGTGLRRHVLLGAGDFDIPTTDAPLELPANLVLSGQGAGATNVRTFTRSTFRFHAPGTTLHDLSIIRTGGNTSQVIDVTDGADDFLIERVELRKSGGASTPSRRAIRVDLGAGNGGTIRDSILHLDVPVPGADAYAVDVSGTEGNRGLRIENTSIAVTGPAGSDRVALLVAGTGTSASPTYVEVVASTLSSPQDAIDNANTAVTSIASSRLQGEIQTGSALGLRCFGSYIERASFFRPLDDFCEEDTT